MKKLLLYSFLIVLTFKTKGQTSVSGFISTNTTWSLANSPYIVIGNTLLVHGNTLTIEPGVVVKFDTSKVLQIDGELIAIGAPDARITFTSKQTSPKAGDWGKIHFADTCINAVFDTLGNYISGCIMKYCDVMYGGGIGYGEIHMVNSSPYFSHCNILNSSTAGIYHSGANYIIDSSSIKNNVGSGLLFKNYLVYACGFTIHDDTIAYNQNGGITFDSPMNAINCPEVVLHNYFLSNSGSGAINSPSGIANLTIRENYFIANSASTGVVSFRNAGAKESFIECNQFINNQSKVISCISDFGPVTIINNIIDNNISNSASPLIDFSQQSLYPARFIDNIVRNNSSSLICSQFACGYPNNKQLLQVHNNSFINNNCKEIVNIIGGGTNATYNFIYFKFNNFNNPLCKYELYNSVPYGSPDIYADSNYWSSTNTQHIDSVIYDFFDYGNLSVVYYQQILTSAALVDSTCSAPLPSAIINVNIPNQSKVFPNPFSVITTIEFGKEPKDGSLVIYNIFGQKVKAINGIENNHISLGRENLPNGVYIYHVYDREVRIASGKLIVN